MAKDPVVEESKSDTEWLEDRVLDGVVAEVGGLT